MAIEDEELERKYHDTWARLRERGLPEPPCLNHLAQEILPEQILSVWIVRG